MDSSAVAANMYMKPRWMCSAPNSSEETTMAAASLYFPTKMRRRFSWMTPRERNSCSMAVSG